jgi:hypothetical protein
MTTAKVSFGFPAKSIVPMAPMGTVSQIASLTLDVRESPFGAWWAAGQTVDISGGLGTASATVTVPQGVDLTFSGHAYNNAVPDNGDEIFSGTGTGNAGSGTLSVSIGMMVNDNGSPITPPTMTLNGVVSCPSTNTGCDATTLVEGSSVAITVNIAGTPGALVTLGGIGTYWSPTGPEALLLDGITGVATRVLTWGAAPVGFGGFVITSSILLESGTLGVDYAAVETAVRFTIALSSAATGSFAFGPVITGVNGMNTGVASATNNNPGGGTDLTLTVTTEATGLIDLGASLEQVEWINTGSATGVAATGGSVTVPGYEEGSDGTLAVTATDGMGLSTTNTYSLVVGQYPAPLQF